MERLKPKAVIFDLGSTLIEYEAVSWDELSKLCALAAREWLLKQGHRLPDEGEFHERFEAAKKPLREKAWESWVEWTVPQATEALFGELEIELTDGVVDRFFDAFYKPVDKLLYIYDDTLEVLQRLRNAYPTIGLISNTVFPESVHNKELTRFGIEPFLDFRIFSSTFGLRKPHPDIFTAAANRAGYAPEECVYIGDRYLEDIEGPSNVGMPAILRVKADREYPEEMPLATRRITTLSELDDHLAF